jgi:tetratricopeptide (TPR) repeat protein
VPEDSASCAILTVMVVLCALAFSHGAIAAGDDGAEMKARTHFAAGEYKEALEIYARLYAETMHPTYLRNIARCHQNLGNPDKAISSFREYLRKAHDLTPDQRKEIEGYIAEMEQLKQSKAKPEPPPATPPPATAPPPAAAPPQRARRRWSARRRWPHRARRATRAARSTPARGSGAWSPASRPPAS